MGKIDPNEILEYLINCPPNTKLYLGADSERVRINGQWYKDITVVCVIHRAGSQGAHIIGEITRSVDYDKNKQKPIMRLMSECYAVAELYDRLKDVIFLTGVEFEIHLDINPDENCGSSIAVQQAIGYIKGTCNVVPFVKPDAPIASYAADRFKEIIQMKDKNYSCLSFNKRKQLKVI